MKKLMMAAMVAAAMAATADDYSFTYQAELKDEKGKALESRNQTVEIRLWKTASTSEIGDLLWGRTYSIYTDKNGLFNQEISDSLGSRTSDDPGLALSDVFCENGAGTVYLGLKVKDSAGEIVPRQRLFAVPFAGKANSANNLVGDVSKVDGMLQIGETASLSANGLNLAASSTSTVGVLHAESVHAPNGDVEARNITFTGALSTSTGRLIIPMPKGGIIMWAQETPPDGDKWDSTGKSSGGYWAICNGNNNTPNLCGRFIVGVGKSSNGSTTYSRGQYGGEEKHTLTTDEMPAHTHKLKDAKGGKSLRGGSDGWHNNYMESDSYDDAWHTDYPTLTAGGDKAHENRPPYYALYYIMRIK